MTAEPCACSAGRPCAGCGVPVKRLPEGERRSIGYDDPTVARSRGASTPIYRSAGVMKVPVRYGGE